MEKLIVAFLFLTSISLSQTTITKVVDPGGTGDYTSLQAWATARGGNLITRNTIEVARCICTNGASDTNADLGTLFTTDATHYVKIYVDSLYRHKGIYPAAGSHIYRIEDNITPNSGGSINAQTSKIIIDGVAIYDSVGNTSGIILTDCGVSATVSNCIIRRYHSAADEHGHGIKAFSKTVYSYFYFRNNIIYGWNDSVATDPVNCGIIVLPEGASSTCYSDNNTIYACEYGIWDRSNWDGDAASTCYVRNTLIQNPVSDGFTDPLHYEGTTTSPYVKTTNAILPYYTPEGLICDYGFDDTTTTAPFTLGNTTGLAAASIQTNSTYWSHSGGSCLKIATGWDSVHLYTPAITGLAENTTYTCSFWDRYSWGITFTVGVKVNSSATSYLGGATTSTGDASASTHHTFTFFTGNSTSVILDIYGATGGGTTYFDDFMIYQGLLLPQAAHTLLVRQQEIFIY